VTARDNDLAVIDPAPTGSVSIGDADNGTAQTVTVRALKIGKLPAFARAVQPLAGEIEAILAGGLTAAGVLALVEQHFDKLVDALHIATGAPRQAIEDSTIEQALELVLAVLAANRDFLRGRMTAAIQTAAYLNRGAGPTP
jgi:hypothetical protein